ncbi:hypothetical protein [Streptomyces azureus]|uniref:hypothetical protein n=1 Tax=Streptomyces azureus TaxID=146537 RepID=UPI001F40962D|nr:hypothetical protein [Streptomyces azureus]
MGFTVTSVLAPAAAASSLVGSVDAPHPTSTDAAIAAVIQPRTCLDGERSIGALASSHGSRNPLKIHDNRFHKPTSEETSSDSALATVYLVVLLAGAAALLKRRDA